MCRCCLSTLSPRYSVSPVSFLPVATASITFWVGYFYTALLFLMFWNKNLYASLILQPIFLGINILGYYRWTHPKKGGGEFFRPEISQGDYAYMASEDNHHGIGIRSGTLLGMAAASAGHKMVCRSISFGFHTLFGCLSYGTDTCGTIPFGSKEMGLLGLSGSLSTSLRYVFISRFAILPIVSALYLINGWPHFIPG